MDEEAKEKFLLSVQMIIGGAMIGSAMAGRLTVDNISDIVLKKMMPHIEDELNNALKL